LSRRFGELGSLSTTTSRFQAAPGGIFSQREIIALYF
jgi:hypothetical protein